MLKTSALRDRKTYILVGLLALLVIVNFREWNDSPAVQDPLKVKKSSAGPQMQTREDPLLLAELLNREMPAVSENVRNIFGFARAEAQAAAQAVEESQVVEPPSAICGNSNCEAGEDSVNCPTDCQPPPPPAPVITLRYIGFLLQSEGPVAFFTDGREVYIGRVNDVIANQYRVLKITEDTVELGLLDRDQRSTIRFQGNQGG